jgi:Flp pilus assembly protein TadD
MNPKNAMRVLALVAAAAALTTTACPWLLGGEEHRRKQTLAKHTTLAEIHWEAGNYEGAADEYRAIIELSPRFPDAYLGLGNCLNKLGKYAEATEAYRKAVELDSTSYDYRFNLGVTLVRMEKPAEAAVELEKAAGLRPHKAEPYIYWGSALRDAGDYAGSAAALARALTLEPKNTFARLNLAMTLEFTDAAKAATEWEKVLNAGDADPAWRELAAERLKVLVPEK